MKSIKTLNWLNNIYISCNLCTNTYPTFNAFKNLYEICNVTNIYNTHNQGISTLNMLCQNNNEFEYLKRPVKHIQYMCKHVQHLRYFITHVEMLKICWRIYQNIKCIFNHNEHYNLFLNIRESSKVINNIFNAECISYDNIQNLYTSIEYSQNSKIKIE